MRCVSWMGLRVDRPVVAGTRRGIKSRESDGDCGGRPRDVSWRPCEDARREATRKKSSRLRAAQKLQGEVTFSMPPTLWNFLAENVTSEVITPAPTVSSMRTAEAAHVPGDCLAKGVVLCHNGGYMLAVLPASHRIRLADLQARLGDDVALAPESEIDQLFRD